MDEDTELMMWEATEYAWDPHRLVAVQDSSPAALHVGITAARTEPNSVVPPVLGAKPATADKASADARCKVEGCDRLLRDEKPYYQRFCICEEHMRSLSITVDGAVSRFCQQCAKFEPIEAFDGDKRSCRARLLEHNKRRRKGVNSRTLRRQRRNAAASSKASRRAKDDTAMRANAPAEQDAAHHDDVDSDATRPAVQQQRGHSSAGGAAAAALSASSSSRAQERSASITRSVSGSIGADAAASGSGSTSKQRKLSSAGTVKQPIQQVPCRPGADAMMTSASAGDRVAAEPGTPHADAQREGCMDCDDSMPVNSACGAAATATAWECRRVVSMLPQLQQQEHTAAVSPFSSAPSKGPSSPELVEPEWMRGIDFAMADDAKECAVDRLLAQLELPTSPVSLAGIAAAAGRSDASLHSSSQPMQLAAAPAAAAAAAAAKKEHSRAASAATACVAGAAATPVALAASSSPSSTPSWPGNSPRNSSTCLLARQVAAAVASLPGMALPEGRTLANVDQMAVPELRQWQQVLQLESKVWPADSQQSKQSLQAAEVVGMLAEYKDAQQHQTRPQQQRQQQQQPAASVQAAALPIKPLKPLQQLSQLDGLKLRQLTPQQSSSQSMDILQTKPAAGATAAGTLAATGDACSAPLPVDVPITAAGVNSAPLPPLCPRPSTSLSANGGCCIRCGNAMCTCHASAPGTGTWSPAAMSTSPALSTKQQHCAQQQQYDMMLDTASLQSSLAATPAELASVPSEVDHATRLPMLSMKALPKAAPPPAAGSRDGAAVSAQKWPQGAVVVEPARMQQQLLQQQEQLQVMQALHLAQQQAMQAQQMQQQQQKLWQQQQQQYLQQKQLLQQQQQQPAQGLTPEQLEEWKVDQELQLMLLEAQMQAALSAGGGSSTALAAPSLPSAGSYGTPAGLGLDALGGLGAYSGGLAGTAQGLAHGHAQMQALGSNPYVAGMPAPCTTTAAAAWQMQQLAQQQQMTWCSSALPQQPAEPATAGLGVHPSPTDASWKSGSALGLDSALQLAQGGGAQASYTPVDSSMRLSLKLHNAHPSQLQPDMLTQLNSMLGSANAAVECGFMRPGCVHLVLQVRAPVQATQQRVQSAVDAAAGASPAAAAGVSAIAAAEVSQVLSAMDGRAWASALTGSSDGLLSGSPMSITMQLPNQQALLIRESQVARAVKLLQQPAGLRSSDALSSPNGGVMPRPLLHAVVPSCICSDSSRSASVIAIGFGLTQIGAKALVRMQGMFLPAAAAPVSCHRSSASEHSCRASAVSINVQQLQPYGLAYVEFQQGLVLSEVKPLLVVDQPEVAVELQEWARQSSTSSTSSSKAQREVEEVLIDFGRLLDFRAVVERHRGSSTAAVQLQRGAQGDQPGGGDHGHLRHADSQSAAAAGPGRHWMDINDSAHENVPFAGVGHPQPAAAPADEEPFTAPAAAAATRADERPSLGATSWPGSSEITPADDSAPAAPALAGNSCSGSSCIGSEHTASSSGSSNFGQHWPAAGAGSSSSSRYKRLRKSLTSSLRAFSRHSTAGADGAASSSSSTAASSSFLSRLKKKLGFVSSNSSFMSENISELGTLSMSPLSRSDCGVDSMVTTANALVRAANTRRAQSLDLSGKRPRMGLALRRLGPVGPASVPSGAGTTAAESSSVGTLSFDGNNSSSLDIGRAMYEDSRQQQREERQAQHHDHHHYQQQQQQQPLQRPPRQSCDSNASSSRDPSMAERHIDHQQTQPQALQQQPQEQQQHQAHPDVDPQLDGMPADDDSAFGAALVAALSTLEPCPTEHPLLGPGYSQRTLDVGTRLLRFFADKGLAASSQLVLDIMLTCAEPAASFASIAAAVAEPDNLGLLHRAVRSGSAAMVLAVLRWGVAHRYCFAWDAVGPMGLTPLHLLALLGQQLNSLGQLVLQSSPAAADMWFEVKAASGATPAMFASSLGLTALNQLAHNVVRQQEQQRLLLLRQQQHLQRLQRRGRQRLQGQQAGAAERPQQQQQQLSATAPPGSPGQQPLQPVLQREQSPAAAQEEHHHHQQQKQLAEVSARLKALLQHDGADPQPLLEQENEHEQQQAEDVPAHVLTTQKGLHQQDNQPPLQQQQQQQPPLKVHQQQAGQLEHEDGETTGACQLNHAAAGPAISLPTEQQDDQHIGLSFQHSQDSPANPLVAEQQQQQQQQEEEKVITELQLHQAKHMHTSTPAATVVVQEHSFSEQAPQAAVAQQATPTATTAAFAAPTSACSAAAAERASVPAAAQQSQGAGDQAAFINIVKPSCSSQQLVGLHLACDHGSSSSNGRCAQVADAPSRLDGSDAACGTGSISSTGSTSSCCKPVQASCKQQQETEDFVAYPGSISSCSSSRLSAGAGACGAGCMARAAQPTWAVRQASHALLCCHQHLGATPWRLAAMQWAATAVKAALVVLLLAALLHHSQGLMLLAVAGVVLVAMLQRLLHVLADSNLRHSLTDAENLQEQLDMLWGCARKPLGVPHSRWTLMFKDLQLENRYREVVASSRLPVDVAISATIKTLMILLPCIARVGSSFCLQSSSTTAVSGAAAWLQWGPRSWSLPMSQQLAGVVAGTLPLAAAMLSRSGYSAVRDSLLFVVQSLLLAVMRKPLLFPAAAASLAAGSGAAGCCQPGLFQSCLAAVLLLLFQQRMSCAVWQVLWDMIGSVMLLAGPGSVAAMTGGAAGMARSLTVMGWLQMLLPLLTLPVLYVWERVDRNMFLSSYPEGKKGKDV